jgi:glyoxylase-like metal-dependent hydrolase (beta-lactamase superfamily II)
MADSNETGTGVAQGETLRPGILQRLSPLVARIVAPNPSVMTGPGTNTYVVGHGELAIVDVGPDDDTHIATIIDQVRTLGTIRWVVATHTHSDHSPGSRRLAQQVGATLVGPLPTGDDFEDMSFTPERQLADGEVLDGGSFRLRAIHTPGHVGNHFCYLVEEDGALMTGDHIMQGSTVVIIPPSGDMKAYLESLHKLLAYPLQYLAPGHGTVIATPRAEIEHLIGHRLKRERKVAAAMARLQRTTMDELTPVVYDDVSPALHPVAQLSLLAHLLKLEAEDRVHRAGDHWLDNGC